MNSPTRAIPSADCPLPGRRPGWSGAPPWTRDWRISGKLWPVCSEFRTKQRQSLRRTPCGKPPPGCGASRSPLAGSNRSGSSRWKRAPHRRWRPPYRQNECVKLQRPWRRYVDAGPSAPAKTGMTTNVVTEPGFLVALKAGTPPEAVRSRRFRPIRRGHPFGGGEETTPPASGAPGRDRSGVERIQRAFCVLGAVARMRPPPTVAHSPGPVVRSLLRRSSWHSARTPTGMRQWLARTVSTRRSVGRWPYRSPGLLADPLCPRRGKDANLQAGGILPAAVGL